MITDNQARAIRMIAASNGGYVLPEDYDKMWFKSAVKPQINTLVRLEYLKPSGFEKEFHLTAKGREAYSEWYSKKGFNMERVIDTWLAYADAE